MATGKTVLILGGGIGGIVAAKELSKKLSRDHRIIVIDREERHYFAPSYLWLMTGDRTAEQISRPLKRLTRRGVEVIRGMIEKISPEERSVVVNGVTYKGDYMIIATGAELAPENLPGLTEAGYNLYTVEGAEQIRDARLKVKGGKVVVLVCSIPFKCPAAPYEAGMLLEYDFKKRGLGKKVTVELYSPEPGPMPVTGPEMSGKVRQLVEHRNVKYFPQHTIESVDAAGKQLKFSNGLTTSFDMLVYVPPHRAPKVVRDAGLTGESGWIPVDKHTLQTKFDHVYALGDVAGIMLPVGKPLPKAGVLAHGQAETVAHNIVVSIMGHGEKESFNGHGECFIEIGHGRAGMGAGNFYAEPAPAMKIRRPGLLLHWGKIVFEKYWLNTI